MTMDSGSYYTNEMFMRAEVAIEKEKQQLLKELEAQRQRELDELRAKYVEEAYRKEEERVYSRYEDEARARAERSNEFVAAPVIAVATVCGAAVRGLLGVAAGPIGVAVGVAAGAAVGAAVGALSVRVSEHCHVQ